MYINASSAISHQLSFKNEGYSQPIMPLEVNSRLQSPIYKEYIKPMLLRRLSPLLRMSLTCSLDCLKQIENRPPDAIIVGTALGCLKDTATFLEQVASINEGSISPTAFIQSTHNTIAGQLSLLLKNHAYNMTHTQNSVSFEHALMDAILCGEEGGNNVLIGAADEYIPLLEETVDELGWNDISDKLTSGASFFMLSKQKTKLSRAKILHVDTFSGKNDPNIVFSDFLKTANTDVATIDLVLSTKNTILPDIISKLPIAYFEDYFGYFYTSPALALHYAIDVLYAKNAFRRILIYNNMSVNNWGITVVGT